MRFNIQGMTCSACAGHIEKAVKTLSGASNVSVNLLQNRLTLDDNPKLTNDAIIKAIQKIGYDASPLDGQAKQPQRAPSKNYTKRNLIISIIFTLIIMYIAMGKMVGFPLPTAFSQPSYILVDGLAQLLITLPVLFLNRHFFVSGIRAIVNRLPNMDSLVALGSSAAWIYSVYILFGLANAFAINNTESITSLAQHLHFESAVMILSLISLGKFFEENAKGKTSTAIEKLVNLSPQSATLIKDDKAVKIPLSDVKVGDILQVKAGQQIPLDGIVVDGNANIDQSMMTGESSAVKKTVNDHVIGATLNQSGYLLVKVTHTGDDTVLSKMIQMVDSATASKAPIARLADKISAVFVPTVIAIALVCFFTWYFLGYGFAFSLSIAISVLIISCPCALGLATPTAIMVGTGKAASNGILFKSAEVIENFTHIDCFLFDKTGTLTEGSPSISEIVSLTGKKEKLIQIAASLEYHSEHPLAKPINDHALKNDIKIDKVSDFKTLAGQGISGVIDGQRFHIGNEALIKSLNISIDPKVEAMKAAGKTVIYLCDDSQLLGYITEMDQIKTTTKSALSALKTQNCKVIMLTGDDERTAQSIASELDIDQVIANVLPQDKAKHVQKMKTQYKRVAMVGDGINDAPALANADIGIAMSNGTEIAIESADIVLMNNDVSDIVTAIKLSQAVMRNVKQNLFWAFIYNVIGIPIAAGVFYISSGILLSPMIAAAAMSLSSVSVVSNALRLNLFKVKKHQTSQQVNKENKMNKIIHIEGMTCGHCQKAVEKALNANPSIQVARVDLDEKAAYVRLDAGLSDQTIKQIIEDAGYEVSGISVE